VTFVMNISPPGASRVAMTNGIGNVWGLTDEPWILWQFVSTWDLEQDDHRVEAWSRYWTDQLHELNKEKNIASEFIYMGDAGDWQNPFPGFPPENVERMKAIRAAYDPNETFSRLNRGGFKLGP